MHDADAWARSFSRGAAPARPAHLPRDLGCPFPVSSSPRVFVLRGGTANGWRVYTLCAIVIDLYSGSPRGSEMRSRCQSSRVPVVACLQAGRRGDYMRRFLPTQKLIDGSEAHTAIVRPRVVDEGLLPRGRARHPARRH